MAGLLWLVWADLGLPLDSLPCLGVEKLNAVKGVQVYIMTHAWQDPNGYPGGGIHERAKKARQQQAGRPASLRRSCELGRARQAAA